MCTIFTSIAQKDTILRQDLPNFYMAFPKSIFMYIDFNSIRGHPFLRTGFTILSTKAFRWVGGSEEGARKNYKCGKTHPLKIKLFSSRKGFNAIYAFNAICCIIAIHREGYFQLNMYTYSNYLLFSWRTGLFQGLRKDWKEGWVGYGKCFRWKDCKTRTQKWIAPNREVQNYSISKSNLRLGSHIGHYIFSCVSQHFCK